MLAPADTGEERATGTARSAPPCANLPGKLVFAVAFAQGLAWVALYRATREGSWLERTPTLEFALWTLVFTWPVFVIFSIERGNERRTLGAASAASALFVLLAAYVGTQASPHGAFATDALEKAAMLTLGLGCFKALMFLQAFTARKAWNHEGLFAASWRNFLTCKLSLAMTAVLFAVLFLWAKLFAALDIDDFEVMFATEWFQYLTFWTSFGVGVLVLRTHAHLLDAIVRVLGALMRWMLPLMLALTALFLASLPFTGLQPLWDSGHGTTLVLWLNAFALLFINIVYQGAQSAPYSRAVHRALGIGVALLPCVSALALVGMYLRVEQHGWTVDRCWGTASAAILAAFSIGYAWAVAQRGAAWPETLRRTNAAMGAAVLALMIVANSPLLDFRKISTANQFARLEAGVVKAEDFDFHYVKNKLARPGYDATQALLEEVEDSDPALAQSIRKPRRLHAKSRAKQIKEEKQRVALWERAVYRPEPFEVPRALRAKMEDVLASWDEEEYVRLIVRVDLDADGDPEYVVLVVNPSEQHFNTGAAFQRKDGQWRIARSLRLRRGLWRALEGKHPSSKEDFENTDLLTDPWRRSHRCQR